MSYMNRARIVRLLKEAADEMVGRGDMSYGELVVSDMLLTVTEAIEWNTLVRDNDSRETFLNLLAHFVAQYRKTVTEGAA